MPLRLVGVICLVDSAADSIALDVDHKGGNSPSRDNASEHAADSITERSATKRLFATVRPEIAG
jgi:hypothetical protein